MNLLILISFAILIQRVAYKFEKFASYFDKKYFIRDI